MLEVGRLNAVSQQRTAHERSHLAEVSQLKIRFFALTAHCATAVGFPIQWNCQ